MFLVPSQNIIPSDTEAHYLHFLADSKGKKSVPENTLEGFWIHSFERNQERNCVRSDPKSRSVSL